MKKILFLISLVSILFCSQIVMADHFYVEYDNYNRYHPYHHHYRNYNGGYMYCNVCGLYHHPDHHHFYHQSGYYDRPVYVEHGRSVQGEIVTETHEIVE